MQFSIADGEENQFACTVPGTKSSVHGCTRVNWPKVFMVRNKLTRIFLYTQEFARKLCSDLGLGGEFVTAVVYSVRQVSPLLTGGAGLPNILDKVSYTSAKDLYFVQIFPSSLLTKIDVSISGRARQIIFPTLNTHVSFVYKNVVLIFLLSRFSSKDYAPPPRRGRGRYSSPRYNILSRSKGEQYIKSN